MSTGNKSKVCNFLFYLQVPQSAGNLTLGHFLAPWMSAEKLKTTTLSLSLSEILSSAREKEGSVLLLCNRDNNNELLLLLQCYSRFSIGLIWAYHWPLLT